MFYLPKLFKQRNETCLCCYRWHDVCYRFILLAFSGQEVKLIRITADILRSKTITRQFPKRSWYAVVLTLCTFSRETSTDSNHLKFADLYHTSMKSFTDVDPSEDSFLLLHISIHQRGIKQIVWNTFWVDICDRERYVPILLNIFQMPPRYVHAFFAVDTKPSECTWNLCCIYLKHLLTVVVW